MIHLHFWSQVGQMKFSWNIVTSSCKCTKGYKESLRSRHGNVQPGELDSKLVGFLDGECAVKMLKGFLLQGQAVGAIVAAVVNILSMAVHSGDENLASKSAFWSFLIAAIA